MIGTHNFCDLSVIRYKVVLLFTISKLITVTGNINYTIAHTKSYLSMLELPKLNIPNWWSYILYTTIILAILPMYIKILVATDLSYHQKPHTA